MPSRGPGPIFAQLHVPQSRCTSDDAHPVVRPCARKPRPGGAVKYLVTGGAGFIGSHLVEALAARGDHVLVLDDLSTGERRNIEHLLTSGSVELVEGSILDEDLVDDCVRSADACF